MNITPITGEDKWKHFGLQSPLISVLKNLHPLNEAIETIINTQTFPVHFAKHEHIASPLKRNRYIFLILKGSVHGYIKTDNKKITTWIAIENNLAGTIRNLWTEKTSEEYIESIEPVLAIAIPHKMSKLLFEQFEIANYVSRKITENYLISALDRALICKLPTAKKRYDHFLLIYPHLLDRVPLRYIASFLGMTPETLSRIRSEMNKAALDIASL